MRPPSWGLVLAVALLGAGLGVLLYRELSSPPSVPNEILQLQQDLAKQREQIEATRAQLLEEIRNKHFVEVRKVYIRAGTQVTTLVEKPEVLARDLAQLVRRARTERILGQTQTSTAVR